MLQVEISLTQRQEEVLAALHAYHRDGQRRFWHERMTKSHWKKTLSQLADLGLIARIWTKTGELWDLTTAGAERVRRLPKAIWSEI